jgi:phosphoenolpyruvate carboxylase
LKCNMPFSPDDILVMEDHELPVCDVCDAKEYHILVNYDGKEDLIDFLGRKVSNRVCKVCIRGNYELVSIKYGNPVKAAVICPNCKAEDKMRIYIKFV